MAVAYVGIGSNVRPEEHVPAAVRRLAAEFRVLAVSAPYETDPVGTQRGGPFWNLALALETDLTPSRLRRELRAIEDALGREREADRNAPRTLDLDLLLLGDRVETGPDLTLPHPQLAGEAFVLVPLAEIAPDVAHPTEKVTVGELRDRLPEDLPGVRALPERAAEILRAAGLARA
jgi:2-amino-4-hydroxy-6-hydroxymethyldihydropteridine diphosphokinase